MGSLLIVGVGWGGGGTHISLPLASLAMPTVSKSPCSAAGGGGRALFSRQKYSSISHYRGRGT